MFRENHWPIWAIRFEINWSAGKIRLSRVSGWVLNHRLLLISCIVFKWQLCKNLKWRVDLIDRKYRMNEGCRPYKGDYLRKCPFNAQAQKYSTHCSIIL